MMIRLRALSDIVMKSIDFAQANRLKMTVAVDHQDRNKTVLLVEEKDVATFLKQFKDYNIYDTRNPQGVRFRCYRKSKKQCV